MFSKLALKNVRRSVKDYGVWFLTIVFGVCLFYVFNALENQSVLRYLAQSPRVYIVDSIKNLIGMLSVFVWVVLAFLILYASGFLIRRRKKELGTYLLLGMERWQVARLLLAETVCIGAFALALGLVLGVLAAWGLSAFTAGLFAVPMTFFTFSVSISALVKTALAFAAIFLLVMVYHAFAVSRCKLIDLMQANRVNQTLRQQSLGASVALFLVGIVLLIIAYAMLLTRGLLRVDALFAGQMEISRAKARRLCEMGLIRGQEGNVQAKDRVRDGQIFCYQSQAVCESEPSGDMVIPGNSPAEERCRLYFKQT